MPQIQFDSTNFAAIDPSPAFSSPAKASAGGADSFDAYLHKAQSTSTSSADPSGSNDPSSHRHPALDASAEASGNQAAQPNPLHLQAKQKNHDKQDPTGGDAKPADSPYDAAGAEAGIPVSASPLASSAATLPDAKDLAATATAQNATATAAGSGSFQEEKPAPGNAAAATAAALDASPAAQAQTAKNANDAVGRADAQSLPVAPQGAPPAGQPQGTVPLQTANLPADAAAATATHPQVQPTASDGNAANQASAAAQLDGTAPTSRSASALPSPAAATPSAQSPGQNQDATATAAAAQANAAATGAAPAGSQDDQERRKNLANPAGDNPASLGAPTVNPNAVAIGAAPTPNTDPAAVSDPTATADKDKKTTADAAVKAAATAASDPSLGTSAGPAQNAVPTGQGNATAAASQPAGSVGQTDQARFLQRVTAAFQSVGDRDGSVRIMLSPPELGSLRLEVSVQNGAMTAHLQAETPAARNLLLDNLPALRDRLADQNIKVDRFDVDLMDRQPNGGTSGQAFYQSQSNSQGSYSGGSGGTSPAAVRPVPAAAVSTSATAVIETTRLNVVV